MKLFDSWSTTYRFTPAVLAVIFAAPIIIAFGYLSLWYFGFGRLANRMLHEDNWVEIVTFFSMFFGAAIGFWLTWSARKFGEEKIVYFFYAIFSFGLFLTAMEEISWGQKILRFNTPEFINAINMQGETNLHNLNSFVSMTEDLRLTFGIGGLIGVLISKFRPFMRISVCPILIPWFLIIVAWSCGELFFPGDSKVYLYTDAMSEVTEMLIGFSGVLYLWLNYNRLSASWPIAEGESLLQGVYREIRFRFPQAKR